MKVAEFTLPVEAWKGLVTAYPADTKLVSSDQFTEGSFNFLTNKGAATKRSGGVFYNTTAFPTPAKDEYEAVFSSGVRHKLIVENGNLRYSSGGGTFSLVTAGYTASGNMEFATYQNRIYFGNGTNTPQVYDTTAVYGGAAPVTVPATKVMGAQPPVSAVTFAADSAGGSVPAGAHTYKVTYLYYDSEESNGGPATGVHTVAGPNFTVNITGVPIGGYGVTARKIYRDDNNGNWELVGTLSDNTTTIFTDTFALGTFPIPLDNGLPPLFSLIVTHRDRLWTAGVTDSPSKVYWSEAGLPDIFSAFNFILCNPRDPITALAVYSDRVLVFNQNSMGQIIGTTASDFRYAEISPSIGCSDNRSIQTRTVRGIPTVVWVSTTGVWQFNGSSITDISKDIEDQIQLNIQQAVQVKGKNTQSSSADFNAGTSSAGIDLASIPGTITTKGYTGTTNPTKLWDTEAEWEAGTSLTNISTNDNSNQISVPTLHAPAFSAGSHNNTVEIASTLRTPVATNYTGETDNTISTVHSTGSQKLVMQRIMTPRNGILNSATFNIAANTGGAVDTRLVLYSDFGGSPSSLLASGPFQTPVGFDNPQGHAFAYALTGNTPYWIGIEYNGAQGPSGYVQGSLGNWEAGASNIRAKSSTNGSLWVIAANGTGNEVLGLSGSYSFTQTAVAASGIWTGPSYDSKSDSAVSAFITHSGSYAGGTSAVTTIEASNVSNFSSGVISQAVSNLAGTAAISLINKRYWRIKVQLTTTDDRLTAQVGLPTFTFSTTGIWISEVIDHSADITALNLLSMVSSVPSGTSAVVEIATSANNIGYSAFTAVGSATPLRYSKVRITLTTTGSNATSATVTSTQFNWTLVSNLISQAIDTGNTPAGWSIFQTSSSANGGTLLFEMRTAATFGALTGASWVTVIPNAFITAPVNPFAQWRVTITSSADQVPQVQSVTVNWLISDVASIRVASLFYNKQYYLAAAEYNQTVNNIVFQYDEDNHWSIFRGLNINTMGTFFNDAYYGSSTVGKLVKWLDEDALTDQGTNIEMDLRTKAFSSELGDETRTKFLRQLVCKFFGTGATFTPTYSIDGGNTFLPLVNVETGLSNFTTNNDSRLVTVRFTPASSTIASGRTLMLRLYNNDDKTVQVHSMRAKCWISPREVLNG